MIEVELSRSGHQVLKKDGRFLSSSFDPVKEAKTWTDRLAPELEHAMSAVLLGLGSGYHWRELKTRFPRMKLTVIENDARILEKAISIHPELQMSTIAIAENLEGLLSLTSFHSLLNQPFRILKHPSSIESHASFYLETERFLLAREPSAFLKNLELRPELACEISPEALGKLGSELISIKTLEKLFTDSPVRKISDERTLWAILSELVA